MNRRLIALHLRLTKVNVNNTQISIHSPFKEYANLSNILSKSNVETGKWIWPCGAIANSMFQDEINLFYGPEKKPVLLKRTGIAWESDKQFKFKNQSGWNATTFKDQTKFVKPRGKLRN